VNRSQRAKSIEQIFKSKSFTLESISSSYPFLAEGLWFQDWLFHIHKKREYSSSFLFRFLHKKKKERETTYDKSTCDMIEKTLIKYSISGNKRKSSKKVKYVNQFTMNQSFH
jgi:hypothetical protein